MALDMLKAALDAFVNRDPAAARAIIPRDKEVDALNKQIHEVLARHMVADPDTIGRVPELDGRRAKASNASPTTPKTSPRKSSISTKRRTSATPARKDRAHPPRPRARNTRKTPPQTFPRAPQSTADARIRRRDPEIILAGHSPSRPFPILDKPARISLN